MAQSKFKVGDVVVLRSGSPKMTITDILTHDGNEELSNNEIETEWLDDNLDRKDGSFSESSLDPSPEDE